MEEREDVKPYELAGDILASDQAPIDKMRQLMSLGYDEEESALLVEQYAVGNRQAVYYEQLPQAPYSDDEGDYDYPW